ncbi:DUF1987 domain-containing protein [Desulfonema magnum]|uniref:DUF1987 n=1 Tax=Desulfonema magnum TaxID=45655 RepID=A0A975GSW8_9BACT|nr:DUF1987 domain-containing protein [Desulfonema magnum]QTA91513.1 DUF1987 [Desulfonema magnum]
MENLKIGATKYTPEISFDCEKNILDIIGESYPENIAEFYAPVFKWLEQYIEQLKNDQNVTINMELIYFNSSSSKVLLDFLDILEQAVKNGKHIAVNWIYEEEDEDTLEFGEEFQEDFEILDINLVQKKG